MSRTLCAEPRVLAAYVRCVPSFGFILHLLVPRMFEPRVLVESYVLSRT